MPQVVKQMVSPEKLNGLAQIPVQKQSGKEVEDLLKVVGNSTLGDLVRLHGDLLAKERATWNRVKMLENRSSTKEKDRIMARFQKLQTIREQIEDALVKLDGDIMTIEFSLEMLKAGEQPLMTALNAPKFGGWTEPLVKLINEPLDTQEGLPTPEEDLDSAYDDLIKEA